MPKKKSSGPTAERFVDETMWLIAELGGSQDVNLRQVSRRVGCAHTNLYNYFSSFDDLLWEAFRRTLRIYAEHLTNGLDDGLSALDYFRRLVGNLAAFPQDNPGLYRFIGSDPFANKDVPDDILETVAAMKRWLFHAFKASAPGISEAAAVDACNIVYAYLDGETFNLINERVVPGEDISSRMVVNAVRVFTLLTGYDGTEPDLGENRTYPKLPMLEAQQA